MAQTKAFVIKNKCLSENLIDIEGILHYYFEWQFIYFLTINKTKVNQKWVKHGELG